jgi:hypothetical protein
MPCAAKLLIGLLIIAVGVGSLWWWFNRPIEPVTLAAAETSAVEAKLEAIQNPTYQKGTKEIVLTERELNGLLHSNTRLGHSMQLELASGALHARVETDLDSDLPVVGGKRLKARARFLIHRAPGHPAFILDDLTVWGISVPNDWLTGIKGRDLLADLLGGGHTGTLPGVEEIKIEPGSLIIRLAE